MPEWLGKALDGGQPLPPLAVLIARVGFALVLGVAVAGIRRICLGPRHEAASMPTTLVLLAVLISVVTVVIGDNLARAFGLVGALSIVRFRTVVEDTRDTAFVICAVVVGMAMGAGYATLAFVALPMVAAAAFGMGLLDRARGAVAERGGQLQVRLGLGHDPAAIFASVFAEQLEEQRLLGAATARQGAAVELTYAVRLRPGASPYLLVAALNRLEGVQSAELKGTGVSL